MSRKRIFSVFRSLHVPLDTQFWTRGFPLVMRSRKADLPLATRARKRELCLYRYVSRMTRTENFLKAIFFKSLHLPLDKSIFFVVFSGNHFSPRFMKYTLFIVSRKLCLYRYVSRMTRENFLRQIFFRSLHLPLDTQFWTRGFPFVMRSRKADLPLATRGTREAGALPYRHRYDRE